MRRGLAKGIYLKRTANGPLNPFERCTAYRKASNAGGMC